MGYGSIDCQCTASDERFKSAKARIIRMVYAQSDNAIASEYGRPQASTAYFSNYHPRSLTFRCLVAYDYAVLAASSTPAIPAPSPIEL